MTKFVAAVIGLSLVAVIGIIIFGSRGVQTDRTTVGDMKTTKPIYQLDKTIVDFGQITVNDVKSADFTFTNTGTESIQLTHFQTSCDCTAATIRVGTVLSPEIGMAGMMTGSAANWRSDLPAGISATITVVYTPSKMPVYGVVERTLKFMANDNDLTLTVKANVQ